MGVRFPRARNTTPSPLPRALSLSSKERSSWKHRGARASEKLKKALGGRLYGRNIITKWCNEGLAEMVTNED